ncbi:plexin-A4-like [Leptopilina heterotoma]|uniref:plexin-A4-like n=1 Tax=Leptopilina heterotoma TaxID=63436 RepID=UPI001CA811B2|nr:plexin-A4-like [Leptopilina heterotoma]
MRITLMNLKIILCFFVILESVFSDNDENKDDKHNAFGFPGWRPPPNRWKINKYCPDIKSCSDCVDSPCTWSLEKVGCYKCSVIQRQKKCKTFPKNTTAVTSDNKNSLKCPSFNSEQKTFFIPSGTNKSITVKANLDGSKDALILLNYRCQYEIEGKKVEVKAKLLADTIYCDPYLFSYESKKPKIQVKLKIYAGGNGYFLENPDDVCIEIYKCKEMANNCKSSSTMEKKYNCGWCEKTNSCENRDDCEKPAIRPNFSY